MQIGIEKNGLDVRLQCHYQFQTRNFVVLIKDGQHVFDGFSTTETIVLALNHLDVVHGCVGMVGVGP